MDKMKILQKRRFFVPVIVVILMIAWYCGSVSVAVDQPQVLLNALTDSKSRIVDMRGIAPVTVNDRTLVPLRAIFEQAGFKVDWDNNTKTAYVTLEADSESELPVEVYCDRLLSYLNRLGTTVKNEAVCVAITLNSSELRVNYEYIDADGEKICMGSTNSIDVCATMITDGYIMLPLRGMMESFGLQVGWIQESMTATVSIPEILKEPENLAISHVFDIPKDPVPTETPVTDITEPEGIQKPEENNDAEVELGEYLGEFKITHYCLCYRCNGSYGNKTAFAGEVRPGITIAVDPSVIKKLSYVYIDGYGVRHAEDTGGAIKGNKIDVAVADHATAMSMGVVYRDVWYVKSE